MFKLFDLITVTNNRVTIDVLQKKLITKQVAIKENRWLFNSETIVTILFFNTVLNYADIISDLYSKARIDNKKNIKQQFYIHNNFPLINEMTDKESSTCLCNISSGRLTAVRL